MRAASSNLGERERERTGGRGASLQCSATELFPAKPWANMIPAQAKRRDLTRSHSHMLLLLRSPTPNLRCGSNHPSLPACLVLGSVKSA